MKRIRLGWQLTKKSWSVLREDRSLMIFPVLSAIATVALLVIVWGPAVGLGLVEVTENAQGDPQTNGVGWAVLIISAYVTTAAAIFFNVALAGCAVRSLDGEDTSVRQGLAIATRRLPQVLSWALLATTVNLILRAIQERAGAVGNVLGAIGGVAWSLATLFVTPILALEGLGPFGALKRSAGVFRQRWGEGMVGTGLIGFVGGLIFLACLVVGGLGAVALASTTPALVGWVALWVAIGAVAAVVMSALNQVFVTALYLYARDGQVEGPFSEYEFLAAFKPAKRSL